MYEELFSTIGVLLVSFFIVYIVIKLFKVQNNVIEGLTNIADPVSPDTNAVPVSGIGATATSYAAAIKAETVKLQDEILVSKYRQDYENVIINTDDLVGMLMIQQLLNIKLSGSTDDVLKSLENLNTLKSSKDSLNKTMAYLDGL